MRDPTVRALTARGRPGGGGPSGGGNTAQQIAQWIAATRTSTTIGGVTVYDLSG